MHPSTAAGRPAVSAACSLHLHMCTSSCGLDPAPDPLGSPYVGRLSPLLRTWLKPRFPHPDATHTSRYASGLEVWDAARPSVLVPLCPSVLWANSTPAPPVPEVPYLSLSRPACQPAGGSCPGSPQPAPRRAGPVPIPLLLLSFILPVTWGLKLWFCGDLQAFVGIL